MYLELLEGMQQSLGVNAAKHAQLGHVEQHAAAGGGARACRWVFIGDWQASCKLLQRRQRHQLDLKSWRHAAQMKRLTPTTSAYLGLKAIKAKVVPKHAEGGAEGKGSLLSLR